MTQEQKFEYRNGTVFVAGKETKQENGMSSFSMGYPLCHVWEHLSDVDDVAKFIADALNKFEGDK